MNVKSLYHYARHSVRERQPERYQNTLDAYGQFERAFPESLHLSKLRNYVTVANNFIERHGGSQGAI
jgi:hypothetical protein